MTNQLSAEAMRELTLSRARGNPTRRMGMADLTILEKRQLERVLQMGSGYVLNFSNRTFQEFVADSVSRDIYDARYAYGGGSKANLLRGFIKEEGNRIVGKLLNDLF